MSPPESPRHDPRRGAVMLAGASFLLALLLAASLGYWLTHHEGTRGEQPPGTMAFYLMVLASSTVGCLVSLGCLFTIRSWRSALILVPLGLIGAGLHGCNVVFALLAYLLEGRNLGG